MVDKGYIIQIDYKEDIEDYIDNIKNFWGEQEIKLVRFELENDQNYYAKVPRISNGSRICTKYIFLTRDNW